VATSGLRWQVGRASEAGWRRGAVGGPGTVRISMG
ncbi:MAG: hypothetical protein JWR64_1605, partial [Marmoricola sp.]|nr:hypothetical protein [Marmoricola sp.]